MMKRSVVVLVGICALLVAAGAVQAKPKLASLRMVSCVTDQYKAVFQSYSITPVNSSQFNLKFKVIKRGGSESVWFTSIHPNFQDAHYMAKFVYDNFKNYGGQPIYRLLGRVLKERTVGGKKVLDARLSKVEMNDKI